MDENGYMMGVAGSSKVVFSKYQKQAFVNQASNREWASLIEAIGTLFVILKGKRCSILKIWNGMFVFH